MRNPYPSPMDDTSTTTGGPADGRPTRSRRGPHPRRGPEGHGHHGHGGRGRGPGGPPPWSRSRARRGDVRLAVLSLLAEEEANGYGLIRAIAERTEDRWRPSPGSVYPTLRALVEEGLVTDTDPFGLSEDGRAFVASHAEELAGVWESADAGGPVQDLRSSSHKLLGALRQVGEAGTDEQRAAAVTKVDALRKELYALLAT